MSHERNPLAHSGHALLSAQGRCRIGAMRRCCVSDYSSAHLSRSAIRPLSRRQEQNKRKLPRSAHFSAQIERTSGVSCAQVMYRSMRRWGQPTRAIVVSE